MVRKKEGSDEDKKMNERVNEWKLKQKNEKIECGVAKNGRKTQVFFFSACLKSNTKSDSSQIKEK